MQLNQNYPWYLQTSPGFTALYNGMYNVAKNITSLDAYKVFYPEEMIKIHDNLAVLYGLKAYANLWQIQTEFSSIEDALVYDVDKWSSTYKWNGETTGLSLEWLYHYIKMKNFINGQVFNLNLLHEALDVLFEGIEYNVEVTEENNTITVNITTENTEAISFFTGLLTVDKTLFGKPIGYQLIYTIS